VFQARRLTVASALIGLATSAGLAAEKSDAKSFLRCGGWDCSLTAVEVKGIDTKEAWALGRATKQDAEEDCSGHEGADFAPCVSEQMARPPLVITADCEEGIAAYSGGEHFNVSAKAKRGELPHAQDPAFWDSEMTHRARTAVITWLNLLCPKASAAWHVRED
jgi:hypothetical protein